GSGSGASGSSGAGSSSGGGSSTNSHHLHQLAAPTHFAPHLQQQHLLRGVVPPLPTTTAPAASKRGFARASEHQPNFANEYAIGGGGAFGAYAPQQPQQKGSATQPDGVQQQPPPPQQHVAAKSAGPKYRSAAFAGGAPPPPDAYSLSAGAGSHVALQSYAERQQEHYLKFAQSAVQQQQQQQQQQQHQMTIDSSHQASFRGHHVLSSASYGGAGAASASGTGGSYPYQPAPQQQQQQQQQQQRAAGPASMDLVAPSGASGLMPSSYDASHLPNALQRINNGYSLSTSGGGGGSSSASARVPNLFPGSAAALTTRLRDEFFDPRVPTSLGLDHQQHHHPQQPQQQPPPQQQQQQQQQAQPSVVLSAVSRGLGPSVYGDSAAASGDWGDKLVCPMCPRAANQITSLSTANAGGHKPRLSQAAAGGATSARPPPIDTRLPDAASKSPTPTPTRSGSTTSSSGSGRARKNKKLKDCSVPGCDRTVRSRGLCKGHGGGRRCGFAGCGLSDQGGGYCISHGGGKRCQFEGCDNSAQSRGLCKLHGGGSRCTVANCTKSSQGRGLCRAHGGGRRCMVEGCNKTDRRAGYCVTHGADKKCVVAECSKTGRIDNIGHAAFGADAGDNPLAAASKVVRPKLSTATPAHALTGDSRDHSVGATRRGPGGGVARQGEYQQRGGTAGLKSGVAAMDLSKSQPF
ncbi:hypothetical protein PybrP1_004724, partial [[Pythium] brassicae (nom. inval.)]